MVRLVSPMHVQNHKRHKIKAIANLKVQSTLQIKNEALPAHPGGAFYAR
jgi:hypothetical protein